MNDYRITFGGPNMETGTVDITERTEDGARRAFKAGYRKIGVAAPDIFDIEIVRENTTATKEQERETLEKIKQMVAELGPQSYLATAFEGCFEDERFRRQHEGQMDSCRCAAQCGKRHYQGVEGTACGERKGLRSSSRR